MIRELKRPRSFYERLFRLTAPIALQNLITFSLGLIDTPPMPARCARLPGTR